MRSRGEKMKINWKKIIAREGLVLLGFVSLSCFLILIVPLCFNPTSLKDSKELVKGEVYDTNGPTNAPWDAWQKDGKIVPGYKVFRISDGKKAESQRAKVKEISIYILLFGYPIYLLIRFILWAIRTLKQKE
jgi:hypothetical protein